MQDLFILLMYIFKHTFGCDKYNLTIISDMYLLVLK